MVETALLLAGAGVASGALSAYFSYKGAKESAKAMKKMNEMQYNLQVAQLMRYKMLFGDIEKNLSNFYKKLSPETYTNIAGVNLEKQYAMAQKNIDRALMQRGLAQSGIAQSAVTNLELSKALAKADIQTKAPFIVADEKMKFVSLGKGIPNMVLNNMSGIAGAQANYYASQNQMYNQQFANSLAGTFSLLGYGLGMNTSSSTNLMPMSSSNVKLPDISSSNALLNSVKPSGNFTLLPSGGLL